MGTIRIVIGVEQAIFRGGLHKLLEQDRSFKVIGETGSGPEVVTLMRKLQPDVLLLDTSLSDRSGLNILAEVDLSATKAIVLMPTLNSQDVREALKLHVRGILLKASATASMFNSIKAVMAGQYWVDGKAVPNEQAVLTAVSDTPEEPGKKFNLTKREHEVIKAIVEGCTNRGIAQRLKISEQTVTHHITNIFNKTGASNRLELTLLVVQEQLVKVTRPGQEEPEQ